MFVDFDNVYIGLQRLDPVAAEAFATNPAHWLSELETGTDSEGEFSRRFLIRACYLNPSRFSQFRPNFTRAGFQVVDCPSLTQQGKSSADINLVLDAVDALAASTQYEEFVIVSADADFTPLALRCRAADRRVTIITASPAAAAYRSVADSVITADDLAELVTHTASTLDVETVVADVPVIDLPVAAEPPAGTPAKAPAKKAAAAAVAATPPPSSAARKAVLQRVQAADRPVPLGTIAQLAQKTEPTLPETRWAGAGGFLPWLARNVPEVGVSSRPPGFVWDANRFGEADLPGAVADTSSSALQRQVVAVTDTPGLSASNYRVLLTALAADLKAHPFDRAETSRRVRDACRKAGAQVGRSTVNFVIGGIIFAGLELKPTTKASDLALAWADNVVGLCRGARMQLSPGDAAAIGAWVGGGLLES
nr:NYN domain-containing protein [Cellulomonas humilata]